MAAMWGIATVLFVPWGWFLHGTMVASQGPVVGLAGMHTMRDTTRQVADAGQCKKEWTQAGGL